MKNLLFLLCFVAATTARAQTFSLQLLHSSDMEAGIAALKNAPHFAALVDTFTRQRPNNTLLLSAGDNYIPSPFFNAASDPLFRDSLRKAASLFYYGTPANPGATSLAVGIGRGDIMMMNILGYRASAVGNHEFDAGPNDFRGLITNAATATAVSWVGAQFPYLSANLIYTTEPLLSSAYTPLIKADTEYNIRPEDIFAASTERKKKIAPATIATVNGERIGIIGLTTQIVPNISSTGGVGVKGGVANNMDTLAKYTQPWVDSLVARGINKIILLSHLQQIAFEKDLLTKLRNVDIMVAGGSHTLMADGQDVLRAGDALADRYPYKGVGLDGKPTVLVCTASEWSYLGRLNVDFNAAGEVLVSSLDSTRNGAFAADSAGVVRQVGAANYNSYMRGTTKAGLVGIIARSLGNIISSQDGVIFGRSAVFLEGRREFVRTQETNLGNLSADANLWYARRTDNTVRVSIKNGGGIRTAIGSIQVDGATNVYTLLPPAANPSAGKQAGDISQLDILNSLRFNNALSLVTVSAGRLARLLNHGVAAWTPSATPGQFPQVGGVRFSFDPTLPAASRVRNAAVVDSNGVVVDTLLRDGNYRGDTARTFRLVTLNFLAGGGDSYPFPTDAAANRVDLLSIMPAFTGSARFAADGTEQDAFAEYSINRYRFAPYAARDTSTAGDTRIQNIRFRADAVFGSPVANQALLTPSFMVYPNPSHGGVRVRAENLNAATATLRVLNPLGQVVLNRTITRTSGGLEGEFSLQFMPTGVYTVILQTKAGQLAQRLVVK
jgi:2',3'-cyclic-nucleotide 2'-phosphodiesterase / 3'-nucleotidase / 5'-nucleotidase